MSTASRPAPLRLGVNVDHVATLRQQRDTLYPDPVAAAALCELAGAHQITVHLREDRRHIQDRDVRILRETVQTRLNLEMANTAAMLAFATSLAPGTCTLVPEKRAERTTEGGLDVRGQLGATRDAVDVLAGAGIEVSLFVDPDLDQLDAALEAGAPTVELHTGDYALATGPAQAKELARLARAAAHAEAIGLRVAAGHGLDYVNTPAVAAIAPIEELNIGHSLISRAVLVGLERAVRELLACMAEGRARA